MTQKYTEGNTLWHKRIQRYAEENTSTMSATHHNIQGRVESN